MSDRETNGIGISNKNHPPIDEQLELARDRGCVILLHEQLPWVPEIRSRWPDVFVVVRLYHPDWTQVDPRQLAADAVQIMRPWLADPLVGLTPANEQNLEPELRKDQAHYHRIGAWNLAFAREFDRLAPDRRCLLVWPALAQGHEPPGFPPDGEYGIPPLREAIEYYDVMATHPYADGTRPETLPGGRDELWHMLRDFRPRGHKDAADPGGVLAQISKPLMWTETGTFVHDRPDMTGVTLQALGRLYAEGSASGRVVGATPFIASSGPEHQHNVIWPNETLRRGLASMRRYPAAALPVARHKEPTVLEGIDVSRWQGPIDWARVKAAGIAFAFIKSSEGSGWRDPMYAVNRAGAAAAGLLWAPYHFVKNGIDPDSQAAHFDAVAGDGYTLPPVLDFEDGGAVDPSAMRRLCEAVTARMGRPIIYTAAWWWNRARLGALQSWAAAYPLWVADYSGAVGYPNEWPNWTIHQYTSSGSVPGVAGNCDRNKFFGTREQLAALNGGTIDPIAAAARTWFDEHQAIFPAPGNALPDSFTKAGLDMYTGEGRIVIAGRTYAVMGGGKPGDTNEEYVHVAPEGDWANVRRIRRR